MAKGKKMSAAVKAKLAAYHRMHKRKAKHNPHGFGGAALGRDEHGRFVKMNPRGADWGYKVGKFSKKAKKGAVAAYGHAREFFGGIGKGYRENPYGAGPFPMPMMNPKRKKAMSAAQRAAHYKSLMKTPSGQKLYEQRMLAEHDRLAAEYGVPGGLIGHAGYKRNSYGSGPFPMPMMNPHHKRHHKSASKARRGAMLAHSLRRDAHGRFLPRGY